MLQQPKRARLLGGHTVHSDWCHDTDTLTCIAAHILLWHVITNNASWPVLLSVMQEDAIAHASLQGCSLDTAADTQDPRKQLQYRVPPISYT